MTQRTVMILAAILGLLVLVILVRQRSDQASGSAPAGLLIPALSNRLDDVDAVIVTGAGASTVATLARGESGWIVSERNEYPANVTKLRAALLALAQARRLEQKTANPAFYHRLGVKAIEDEDANGVLISIGGVADEPVQVIIGDAAGSDYRYVRLKDEATSWLIDRDPDFPRSTGEWLQADLLDVNGDRVQSITVSHPDGERLQVAKSRAGQADFTVDNIPAGRELLYKGVANAMGDVLEKLSLEDVEPASADADAPVVVTEYRTFDGLVITATAANRDDSAWVSFAARFDPAQAEEFVAPAEQEATDTTSDDDAQTTPVDTSGDKDVAGEAAQINAKLSGWRYKITRFKFEQITRDMEDLLQAPPDNDS